MQDRPKPAYYCSEIHWLEIYLLKIYLRGAESKEALSRDAYLAYLPKIKRFS
jgi:hypothetical protein